MWWETMVEAQGIEPWSESILLFASTCVCDLPVVVFGVAGRQAFRFPSPLFISPLTRGHDHWPVCLVYALAEVTDGASGRTAILAV